MIYTPEWAYNWLMSIGLGSDDALRLIESREKFEYFCGVLEAMVNELR